MTALSTLPPRALFLIGSGTILIPPWRMLSSTAWSTTLIVLNSKANRKEDFERNGKCDYSMNTENVAISLKRFLLVKQCPASWKDLDLYLFRDENVVFYVGQSYLAFARVWEHLINGFKGHSIVGRFVWCNWPKSMNFTIELLTSQSEQFGDVRNELSASERLLIQRWSPCFNLSQNNQPTPLPNSYLPPNAPFRRRRSLNMLMYEAERAVKAEDLKLWLENME